MTLIDKIEEIVNERKYGFTVKYFKNWIILSVPEDVGDNKVKFALYYFEKGTLILSKKIYEKALSVIGKTLKNY